MANYRTKRPIYGKAGNIIPALRKVTQKDVSASIQELLQDGYIEVDEAAEKLEAERLEAERLEAKKPKAKKK